MALDWDQRQRFLREENWTATDLAQELFASMSPDRPQTTEAPIEMVNSGLGAPLALRGFSDGDTFMSIFRGSDSFSIGAVGGINLGPMTLGDINIGAITLAGDTYSSTIGDVTNNFEGSTIGGLEIEGVNFGGDTYDNDVITGDTIINYPNITNGGLNLSFGGNNFPAIPPANVRKFTMGDMKFAFDLLRGLRELGLVGGNNPAKFDKDAFNRLFVNAAGGGVPCKIGAQVLGSQYSATVYLNGIAETGTAVTVTQLDIADDEVIPEDTWTIATKINNTYYVQVDIWL